MAERTKPVTREAMVPTAMAPLERSRLGVGVAGAPADRAWPAVRGGPAVRGRPDAASPPGPGRAPAACAGRPVPAVRVDLASSMVRAILAGGAADVIPWLGPASAGGAGRPRARGRGGASRGPGPR